MLFGFEVGTCLRTVGKMANKIVLGVSEPWAPDRSLRAACHRAKIPKLRVSFPSSASLSRWGTQKVLEQRTGDRGQPSPEISFLRDPCLRSECYLTRCARGYLTKAPGVESASVPRKDDPQLLQIVTMLSSVDFLVNTSTSTSLESRNQALHLRHSTPRHELQLNSQIYC